MVTLSCAELPVREINRRLRATPPPRDHLDGNAGYYIGGLCDGPDVTVNGFVGWGVGENLMPATVRVNGNASESAGASARQLYNFDARKGQRY